MLFCTGPETRTHQHPFVLAPKLQGAGLHNSGWDVVQVDKLKTELAFAPSDIQHATATAEQLPPKCVNQEPASVPIKLEHSLQFRVPASEPSRSKTISYAFLILVSQFDFWL